MSYAPTRPWTALLVHDVMTHGVVSCPASTPLASVAESMAARRIHCVVVADMPHRGDGAPTWGVLSDLDLIRAAVGGDLDGPAAGAAATETLAIDPQAPLQRAAQVMAEHDVAHLVVVPAGGGLPIGVVSSLDLAAAIARDG